MIDTSMSAILKYLQCQKYYDYRYVRGLVSRQSPSVMDFGTLIHEGLANIYRFTKATGNEPELGWAHERMNYIRREGIIDKETLEIRLLNLQDEDWTTAFDVVDFYFEQVIAKEPLREIVAVEEPYHLELAGYRIRGTFDLVFPDVVRDFKTTSNVHTADDFTLDFQTLFYELLAYRTWGRPVEFEHEYIRREVPPGFGTRPVRLNKDGSVAKNNASTDPADYIQRVRHTRSVHELDAFQGELQNILTSMWGNTYYLRSPNKRTCPQCPYYALCGAELSGHKPIDSFLRMRYNVTQSANC